MHSRPLPQLVCYGLAVLLPALTLLVRWPLHVVLGDRLLYMAFFPAVIVAAYLGGLGPGLLATLVSALVTTYFLVDPLFSLQIVTVHDGVAVLLFLLVGAILSVMSDALRRAQRRIIAAHRSEALRASEEQFRILLFSLPAAVYATDREGRITQFNNRAVELWGRHPQIGEDMWFGSWRIFRPDGTPVALDQSSMALTLRDGRTVPSQELILERPDGRRACVRAHSHAMRDSSGAIIGAANILVEITARTQDEGRSGQGSLA